MALLLSLSAGVVGGSGAGGGVFRMVRAHAEAASMPGGMQEATPAAASSYPRLGPRTLRRLSLGRSALPSSFAASQSERLEKKMGALQSEIDDLGRQWSAGLANMQAVYEKQKVSAEALDNVWKERSATLKDSCLKLRTTLEKLAETKGLCQVAQNDETRGLPALFKKSRADPQRFKSWGAITGCATAASELEAGPCTCTSGSAALGCKDAKSPEEKELLCTKVIQRTVPELNAVGLFQEGGACEIDGAEEISAPLIGKPREDTSAPSPEVQESTMAEEALLFGPLLEHFLPRRGDEAVALLCSSHSQLAHTASGGTFIRRPLLRRRALANARSMGDFM